MSIHKHTFFTNQRDVWMREDALYPTPQLRHHLSHTLTSLIEGGSVDIGLRGDAAYIQTGASHLRAFKDHDLQALFGGIFSGAVATRSRADNNEISCCH